MELQTFVNVVTVVVGGVFGWFFKIVWNVITELQQDMKDTNRVIHEKYVRKDDYRAEMAKIENMFNRIMDKLDGKVDK